MRKRPKTPDDYRAEGSSKSLRKSIRELEEIIARQGIRIGGGLRGKFYRRLEDFAEQWYRRGFWRAGVTIKQANPKALRRLGPITAKRKVWFLGRGSGLKRVRPVTLTYP